MFRGLACSLLSAVSFGTLAILVKLGHRAGMTDLALLQYRFLFGAALLFLYLLIREPHLLRIRPAALGKAALLGFVLYGLQSTLFFKALRYIPASTASLILYVYPVVVTVLSVLFLGLRAGRTLILSLAVLTAGCCLVFYDAFLRDMNLLGILLAFGTTLTFSLYLVLTQVFLKGEEPLSAAFYVILSAAVLFLFLHDPLEILRLDAPRVSLALLLGLVPTAVAIVFLFRAIAAVGSAYTAVFSTLEPVTTVVLAAVVLGEAVVLLQWAGMALIVAGIAAPNLEQLWKGRRGAGQGVK
jgi:drug/metabolite transporter (DMT)-like permease